MRLSEAIQINEATQSLSSYIASLGINRLPIRLKSHIDVEFGGNFNRFIEAVVSFETRNPSEASRILSDSIESPVKLSRLLSKLGSEQQSSATPMVSYQQVRNRGSHLIDDMHRFVDDTGATPSYLFRYVAKEEMDYIERNGYLAPSSFYGRVHASYAPDRRYMVGGGSLLAIKYDPRDQWRAKQASGEVYAVTYNRIDISKISKVRN